MTPESARASAFLAMPPSWLNWIPVQPLDHVKRLPRGGGAYAVYESKRLSEHRKSGAFVRAYVKIRPARYWGDWATLELRLIGRLQPYRSVTLRGTRRESGR